VTLLHIRCGDDLRVALAASGIGGDYLKWCDPLSEGPCPEGVEGDAWYALRARFIASRYGEIHAAAYGQLIEQDDGLARSRQYDELVLWFEHDLFDQAILGRLLAWAAETRLPPLTLVQARDYVGEMDAAAVAHAFAERLPVMPEQLALGERFWEAWRAPTPEPLVALMDEAAALPCLGDAVKRHFEDFPDSEDGLALTERLILFAIADGARDRNAIFAGYAAQERARWLGDLSVFAWLDDLAGGAHPLVARDALGWRLTPTGTAVLAGKIDALTLRPCDRWRGGVHLEGRPGWRWSRALGRLVG
jgi:hypothetical protein